MLLPFYQFPRRKISRAFIHCSASDAKAHDNVDVIRKWHVVDRGWTDIGYHYVITKEGFCHVGRDLERKPAAQKRNNTATIAICVTGLTLFSAHQMSRLLLLCLAIDFEHPGITFHGHTEVDKMKSCPVFDYRAVLRLDDAGTMFRN